MKIKITINCCMCQEKHTQEIELPTGWNLHYGEVDEENGFCPTHAPIAEWAESQCPGCVGGWKDCALWQDFAYQKRGLTCADLDTIRAGSCPRRTNGSFMINGAGVHEADISTVANTESGEAFAQAILEYWDIFGTREG